MDIAEEVLARKRPVIDKVIENGFRNEAGILTYSESIMDGDLTCMISIYPDSSVKCRLIDSVTREEYTPVNIESYTGSYVGRAREEYRAALEKISESCFSNVLFASDQANRIALWIEKTFDSEPEHPFRKSEGIVYRHKDSERWFLLAMNFARGKLDGADPSDIQNVDVMNIKIEPDNLNKQLDEPGIFKCYHMNKKMWVSIVLDDTLTDDRVKELINKSFELTNGSPAHNSKSRERSERAYWIIPSNPSHYDVAGGFRRSPDNTIPWHHRINVLPGDIVYIYQTEPVAALMFKTEVVDSFLPRPASWSGMAPSSKYRMNIKLIEKYDKEMYPRKWLNEHGVKKTVRGQRSAPEELVDAIEEFRNHQD